MIIVTGMPRSGTSLMMQTLDRLGITALGRLFPKHRIRSQNPKGFYELPESLHGDLTAIEGNVAVKVLVRKMVEYVTLDPGNDRIIICRRETNALAAAITSVGAGSSSTARNVLNIGVWYGRMNDELDTGGKFETVPRLDVDIDAFRADPSTFVSSIATFTSARMTDHTEAVGNVDP